MNKWIGIGNLTQDIELKQVGDKVVTSFSLACNTRDKVDFINCEVWGKQAENLHKYCMKGSKIAVEGRINITSKDGKYYTKVIVESVSFLSSKKQESGKLSVSRDDLANLPFDSEDF